MPAIFYNSGRVGTRKAEVYNSNLGGQSQIVFYGDTSPVVSRVFIKTTGDNSNFANGSGDWSGEFRWLSAEELIEYYGSPHFTIQLEFIGTAEGLYDGLQFNTKFDYYDAADINYLVQIWSDGYAQTQNLGGGPLSGDGTIDLDYTIPNSWAYQITLKFVNPGGTPVLKVDNVVVTDIT